ncbi:hypothetical protein K435DRAFT_772740 [Dendrothele bispora CBS 962.96]|uniref:Uncharacterized protein n=1 Tax=Dendrothele bispora (strain CBS 962.96) TaxID=1314807 RepID=A0A4S8MWC7_DENBC|nr:hypothetical protein K435DRAFT_772740 [Dendrothele bispora CBS 962.96]
MSESLAAKLDRYFILADNQYAELRKDTSASELRSYNSQINQIVNSPADISSDTILEDIRKAEAICKKIDVSSAQERIDIISAAFTIINGIVSSDLPKHPDSVQEEVRKHYQDSKSNLVRLVTGDNEIGEEISEEFISSFTEDPKSYIGKPFILNPDSETFGNDEALQYKIEKVQTDGNDVVVFLRFEELPDVIELPLDEAVLTLRDSWFA